MNFFSEALLSALRLLVQFNPDVYTIAGTSLQIALQATGYAAVFAIPTGILIAITHFPGKVLLQHLLNTLQAMPTVMIGLIFYGLLSRRGALGDWGLLYTDKAVILGETALILPLIISFTITAVHSSDPGMLRALQIMGAKTHQKFIPVIKELRFALLAALITAFGRAIGEVGAAMMLGGNIQGTTRTMTTAIALETSKGNFEQGLALGILLLTIAFCITYLLHHLQRSNP
jgi:tungstate transport system permease protein